MDLNQKIKIIWKVLKGEEFVLRAEGTAVNDNTVVIVNFFGNIITERSIKDFYNPKTGKIELVYDLE